MITTVTLNASIDKAYFMKESIENGTVMRVDTVRNTAGGKGLNVARAAKACGEAVKATGMVGGYNGKYLLSLLDKDGVPQEFVEIQGETRSCINILDPKYASTEYLEPGCAITEEEEAVFEERFPEIIADSEVVTISGSIPKGMKRDIYYRMILQAKELGKQVILDTSGDLLEQGMTALPTMIKPNQDEMALLFHRRIENREEVIQCAVDLHKRGIPYVVISLGGDGALLVCDKGIIHGKPPKVKVVNTVGCGDSMVGAFAVALKRGYEPEQMMRFAVAVATANALSPNTGDVKAAVYEELLDKVIIEWIE